MQECDLWSTTKVNFWISTFLVYINDLWCSTSLLETIMFADDTNLFYSHNDVKELFQTMNAELIRLNDWFCANKLSLNTDKTN